MGDIVRPMSFTIDLDKRLFMMPQRGHLTRGDIGADEIRVKILRGGEEADLSGCGAGGKFYRPPDQAEITLEATIEGDTVIVPLTDHCYAQDGYYVAEVYLTKGGSKTTVLAISGEIYRAGSGAVVDIEGVIPSLDALLALIDDVDAAKQAALDAAMLIRSATANATTLATGEDATVDVSEQDGAFHFEFGLPRGTQGPAGSIDNVTIESIPGLAEALDPLRQYPVGSVYINTTDLTSPASRWGGDWLPITDKFLLAAGSSYIAGSTGGEAAVLLTIATMPSHAHNIGILRNALQSAENGSISRLDSSMSTLTDAVVEPTGGGEPHNNMPPYLTVYMWERVA